MRSFLSCFLLIFLFCLQIYSLVQAKIYRFPVEKDKIKGFGVDLIHRHSPQSPFYNSSATIEDLARQDFHHTISRKNHFRRPASVKGKKLNTPVVSTGGAYLMKISVGTPPVERLNFADTGSDIIWFQCAPCIRCYPEDRPILDPKKSSSYKLLPYDSPKCQVIETKSCGGSKKDNNTCQCATSYADGSYTKGDVATDTFSFGTAHRFPNTIFGCGHDNAGLFTGHDTGVTGLGQGPLLLITQLKSAIQQKFSYGLLPGTTNATSKLKFGTEAVVSEAKVVSTPILTSTADPFYYVNLKSVSVGKKKIAYQQDPTGRGSIIIDSGTKLTLLPGNVYTNVEAEVKQAAKLKPKQDPGGDFPLCYDKNAFKKAPEVPIVFHFARADVPLKSVNTFIDIGHGLMCFGLVPSDDLSVYGNTAHINYNVGYDLRRMMISFAPADCTK